MKNIDPQLYDKLAVLVSSMGYELYGCEITSEGGRPVFRVYIDSPNGVSIDACAQVSRQIGAMLDVEDPIQNRYALEVSSPGVNRSLFSLSHFEKHLGSIAKLRLYTPINERRHYTGRIRRVEGNNIALLVLDSEQEIILPFSAIEKANIIGEVW